MTLKELRKYVLCEGIWLFDREGNIIDFIKEHSETKYDDRIVISINASYDELEIVIE